MNTTAACRRFIRSALVLAWAALAAPAAGAPLEPVLALAGKEKTPLLETLKDLVSIESGSGDRDGLDKIAKLIAGRLQALGGKVEMIESDPADIYRMVDTPKQIGKMVLARFTGTAPTAMSFRQSHRQLPMFACCAWPTTTESSKRSKIASRNN